MREMGTIPSLLPSNGTRESAPIRATRLVFCHFLRKASEQSGFIDPSCECYAIIKRCCGESPLTFTWLRNPLVPAYKAVSSADTMKLPTRRPIGTDPRPNLDCLRIADRPPKVVASLQCDVQNIITRTDGPRSWRELGPCEIRSPCMYHSYVQHRGWVQRHG